MNELNETIAMLDADSTFQRRCLEEGVIDFLSGFSLEEPFKHDGTSANADMAPSQELSFN